MALRTTFLLASLLIFPAAAVAQGYEPDPLEPAPDGQVECSWSSMKGEEYQNCLKKKDFFSKMKPEEKEEYNKEVYERQIIARIESLERRVDFLESGRRR